MKRIIFVALFLMANIALKAQNSELQLKINAIKLQYYGLQPAWYGEYYPTTAGSVGMVHPMQKLFNHPHILINNQFSGMEQLANYSIAQVEKITIILGNSGIPDLYSPYKENGAIMVYTIGYTGSRIFPYMTQELGQTVYTAP